MSVARQVDYDALFAELVAGGMRAEEAAAETHETFLESNYDTSGMFAYRTEEEHGLKCALMDKFRVISQAAAGNDTFVNANFSFQGLVKILSASDRVEPWRLLESLNLMDALVRLLDVDAGEDKASHGEDDSEDEDDADAHRKLQVEAVLNFMLFFILRGLSSSGSHSFRAFQTTFLLTEPQFTIFIHQMDEYIQEKATATLFVRALSALLSVRENAPVFHACHGAALVELGIKVHRKSADLLQALQAIKAAI